MRIACCELEAPFQITHDLHSEHVFDFIRVLMDMIGCVLCRAGEVKLPKTMVAHDLAGSLPASRSQEDYVAIFTSGGEAVLFQFHRLGTRLLQTLSPKFRQFAQ